MGDSPYRYLMRAHLCSGTAFIRGGVMAQIFGKSSNSLARATLVFGFVGFFGFWGLVYGVYRSPYTTDQNVPREQEVPFSHQHHVAGLGIDCRYCHDCHEAPERYVRPKEEVFNMKWESPADQMERGRKLILENQIETQRLRDCGVCHR